MSKRWVVTVAVLVAVGGTLSLGAVTLGAGRTLWSRLGYPQLMVAGALERNSVEQKTTAQGDETDSAEPGIVIVHIAPDSPAAKAGLQRGDILLGVNDTDVNNIAELSAALASFTAEDEVTLRITRGGEAQTLTATLIDQGGRTFLGISGGDCGAERGTARIEENGAYLVGIADDSPASAAGLQAGETIIAVDGEAITTGQQLADAVAARKPGDTVTLTVQAVDDTERDVSVTFAAYPDDDSRAYLGVEYGGGFGGFGGRGDHGMLSFPPLTEGMTGTAALVVGTVETGSAADDAGLQEGDQITEIDGTPISDLVESGEDVSTIFADYQPGDTVALTVVRRDETAPLTLTATLEAGDAGTAKLGIQAGIIFSIQSGDGAVPNLFVPAPNSQGLPALPDFAPNSIPEPALPEVSA